MKAITISQPFASLIADGRKWIENRNTEWHYRGPIAIHAGKGTQYLTRKELERFTTGAVVATADLVACCHIGEIRINASSIPHFTPVDGLTWRQIAMHEHCEGPWCLILRNVQRLELPVPAKGSLGLWNWSNQ